MGLERQERIPAPATPTVRTTAEKDTFLVETLARVSGEKIETKPEPRVVTLLHDLEEK